MSDIKIILNEYTTKPPILFIVFNRLFSTIEVFNSIKKFKPTKLYIASDGPRLDNNHDASEVIAIRDYLIANIDWDCELKTLFREKNLGCKYAVSEAINWFFDNEECGIILEDDCLPNESFFLFCQELLVKYKDDLRIWHISGNNFQNSIIRGNSSYYFSKFSHIWGWATWANRWKKYDVELSNFDFLLKLNGLRDILENKQEIDYWEKIFRDLSNLEIDTWDYQWTYTVWVNNGLSILPNKNLISNIGFGQGATHTTDLYSLHSNLPRQDLSFPLIHPLFVFKNKQADNFTSLLMYRNPSFIKRVFNKLKRFL
jgi:hypothetical protein